VTRIERSSRVPTIDTLERLAGALDVGVEELVRTGGPARPARAPTGLRRVVALIEREPPHVLEAVEVVVRAVLRALHETISRRK
jgi:transcriptional regulator with XRE-family HTH domain